MANRKDKKRCFPDISIGRSSLTGRSYDLIQKRRMGKGQRPSCLCHFLNTFLFQMFNLPRSLIMAVACSVVCQPRCYQWASLVAQMVKTLPAV